MLLPARPRLTACLEARAGHLGRRGDRAGAKLRALSSCERRIDDARAEVLAADDGVVTGRMTALEREWRKLASPDPEAGLMDLWAELAPPGWIDRKRFRDAAAEGRLDAVVALASDPDGVDTAERAAVTLRRALAPHGVALGERVVWRPLGADRECLASVLSARVGFARAACPREIEARVVERAQQVRSEVERAVLRRYEDRPLLAAELAAAAELDFVWQASSLASTESPVEPLRVIYECGYALAAADAASVVLEFPAVPEG